MAQARYDSLFTGLDYEQFQPVWTEFLLALNAAFSKLEKGARGCGKSEAWINRHKNTRRKDPLLSYLHQARNADEHGLEPVSSSTPGKFKRRADGAIIVAIGRIHLAEVVDDRFGDRYPVPQSHLGQPIAPMTPFRDRQIGPWETGKLGLAYLWTMLAEARSLPTH